MNFKVVSICLYSLGSRLSECINLGLFFSHLVALPCQEVNTLSTPHKSDQHGFRQEGKIYFQTPVESNEWKITLIFNKTIANILVYDGSDEMCLANFCIFKNTLWNGAKVKSDQIILDYQIEFETEGAAEVLSIGLNEYDVCLSKSTGALSSIVPDIDTNIGKTSYSIFMTCIDLKSQILLVIVRFLCIRLAQIACYLLDIYLA